MGDTQNLMCQMTTIYEHTYDIALKLWCPVIFVQDFLMFKAVAIVESNLKPTAYNSTEGAMGLFQIRWAACFDVFCDYSRLFEPDYNIEMASAYFRKIQVDFGASNWKEALYIWNGGIGLWNRLGHVPNAQLIAYMNKVYQVYRSLGGSYYA